MKSEDRGCQGVKRAIQAALGCREEVAIAIEEKGTEVRANAT
jgi:hypothetical protein